MSGTHYFVQAVSVQTKKSDGKQIGKKYFFVSELFSDLYLIILLPPALPALPGLPGTVPQHSHIKQSQAR